MLALFSLLSLVSFAVVGATVGWRVLRLSRRTPGATPERWIAWTLLPICGVGYPLLIVAQVLSGGAARVLATSLGIASVNVGLVSIFMFTRAVFRPEVPWVGRALALPIALLVAHWLGATHEVWVGHGMQSVSGGRWILLSAVVSGAGSAWTALESFSYWTAARRRLAHGLADPLVVNRIALWGVVGVSTVIIDAINFAAGWRGINVLQDPFAMIGTGTFGLLNAIALWLAFAPPAAWVRYVRGPVPA